MTFYQFPREHWPHLRTSNVVESPFATVSEFYVSRLPGAQRTTEAEEVRFQTSEGTIKLARLGAGTRITLTIGPR